MIESDQNLGVWRDTMATDDFFRARLDQMIASTHKAYQRVHVQLHGGAWVSYLFILSCQQDSPYPGCWMTDLLIRVS